jgi:flagellin
MSFRINTNVSAMSALRNLTATSTETSSVQNRLSTGLRINSAADDPAGLAISEGFRSQLSGINQALRNSQDASNFAKTAEGALSEVASLLTDARSLAVANSNDATLSASQKQANQNQLNSILTSIDRIASNTQFGTKKLLNGSAGVTANVTNKANLESVSIGGTFGAGTITANDTLTITTSGAVAARATVAGGTAYATGATTMGAAGKVSVNGVSFDISAGMTRDQVVSLFNSRSADTGVAVGVNGTNNLTFTSNSYGTGGNSVQVTTDTAGLVFAAAGSNNLTGGANATATFSLATSGLTTGALTAQASDGLTFRDTNGNVFKISATAGTAANAAYTGQAAITAGSAQFQIGANAGQTASLSLANASASALGVSGLDITTTSNAATALASIDAAVSTVSTRRGDLGNFMRNVVDSNVRSLGIARENLSAADSSIRDADIAQEMTRFTQLQILQQSGISMLAQANSSSQAVLSLLR